MPTSTKTRHPSGRALLAIAVVALLLVGYVVYRIRAAHAPFEWSGTVEAHTIEVGSRVGGRVKEVHAREGDTVTAGQPLVTLEIGDLLAQRLQAEGQLAEAEGALEKVAHSRLPSARAAEIAQARARLAAQRVVEEKARRDAERLRNLTAKQAAPRVDLDTAESALRNASAQALALSAQLEQLERGTPQDVKAAQGQVDVARGRVQQINVLIDELVIRASRPARVESLDLRPGDILAPNVPAARLLEPLELYVRIYVPETQIGHLRPGQEVPIYVDSFPGQAFRGRVESVASEGQFTPRNLQTADERADQVFASRVRIEEGRDRLRAGMAAWVKVPR
jgi:HlyD family secretion protein